jgi:TIR domain
LVVGAQFDQVIEEQLDAAFAVIVLWSRAAVGSKWVRAEASSALDRDVLVPIMIEACKVPLRFRTLQLLDLTGWTGDPEDPRLRRVAEALTGPVAVGDGDENATPGSGTQRQPPQTYRPSARVVPRRWSSRRGRWAIVVALAIAAVSSAAVLAWVGTSSDDVERAVDLSSRETGTPESTPPTNIATTPVPTPAPSTPAPTPSIIPPPVSQQTNAVPETIVMEAEDQRIVAPMTSYTDPNAQGAAYVESGELNSGVVRFDFDISQGGDYWVWGRFASADPQLDHNSLAVKLDNAGTDVWDFFENEDAPGAGWHWELISLRCGGSFDRHLCDPWPLRLEPGGHSLTFAGREPQSGLDVIAITNDPNYVPPRE